MLYYHTVLFDFSVSRPFQGKSWYNPYEHWQNEPVVKANFHAHSRAWGGVTNGGNTFEEMEDFYRKKDYKLAAISNYHWLAATRNPQLINFPVYEHGFNVMKAHKLALGAEEASFLDFPFWQNISHKQLIINKIRQTGALVAIAHPNLRNGHSPEDLQQLHDYQFIEIRSRYANALSHWDAALKSGHPAWALANDDSHDLELQKPGNYYNLIPGQTQEVRSTLQNGTYLAVESVSGNSTLTLRQLFVEEDTLFYDFGGNIKTVKIVKDGEYEDLPTTSGQVKLGKSGYVRFEISDDSSTIYTNPVIRYNGNLNATSTVPTVNVAKTFLFRIAVLLAATQVILFLFPSLVPARQRGVKRRITAK